MDTQYYIEALERRCLLSASFATIVSLPAAPSGGVHPFSPLIKDSSGNIYGSSLSGGVYGYGTIFKISAGNDSSFADIYSFTNSTRSWDGPPGLAVDRAGNLYFGSRQNVGPGAVYELPANQPTARQLFAFTGASGAYPGYIYQSCLCADSQGNLFGSTDSGGSASDGVLFELSADHSTFWTLSFTGSTGSHPGSSPTSLLCDTSGNVFGITGGGGAHGYGSIFQVGSELSGFSTIYSFASASTPYQVAAFNLLMDTSGNFFGIYGSTVFELSADHKTFTTIAQFGQYDYEDALALAIGPNSDLIGIAAGSYRGSYGGSSVFDLASDPSALRSLYTFSTSASASPQSVTTDSTGDIVGVTQGSGSNGLGSVFKIDTSIAVAGLTFVVEPTNTVYGSSINSATGVQIAVTNIFGQVLTAVNDQIVVGEINGTPLTGYPSAATANGVTTFDNLQISRSSSSQLQLVASDSTSPGASPAISSPFVVENNAIASVATGQYLGLNSFPTEVLGALTIAGSTDSWTGTLDISNINLDLISGSLSAITNQIHQGYNSGSWSGDGVISRLATYDSKHMLAVGAVQNNQSGGVLFSAQHLFGGTTPGIGDILVKCTYYGDANLDGKVDGSDYSLIDSAILYNKSHPAALLTGWYNGDFNYDGIVDGSDYTLIDNAFNQQGASLAAMIAPVKSKASAVVASASRATFLFSQTPVIAQQVATESNSVAAAIFGQDVEETRTRRRAR